MHSSSNASSCSSQRSSSSSATVVPPAPVEFRASPPLHVHRPYNGSPPPKVFHAAAPVGGVGLGPTTLTLSASAHIPAFEVCAVSPRKRHRQDRGGGTAFGVFSLVDGGPVQRPCLDFEKMQQVSASPPSYVREKSGGEMDLYVEKIIHKRFCFHNAAYGIEY